MPPTLRNRRNQPETTPRVVEVDTDEEDEITRTAEQQRERLRVEKEKKKTTRYYEEDEDDKFYISLLDVIRMMVTFVVLSVGLSYYVTSGESYIWGFEKQRPWWMRYNDIRQYMV